MVSTKVDSGKPASTDKAVAAASSDQPPPRRARPKLSARSTPRRHSGNISIGRTGAWSNRAQVPASPYATPAADDSVAPTPSRRLTK
ncbi:MAG TPA: hypothetical protein VL961_05270 [Acidimicrobiales bacterium]|nr:hypothetical protein [Acidimicrobiales bacterium]